MTVPTVPTLCPTTQGTPDETAVVIPGKCAQNCVFRHSGHTGHTDVHEGHKCLPQTFTVPATVPSREVSI